MDCLMEITILDKNCPMRHLLLIATLSLFAYTLAGQNQAPVIKNLSVTSNGPSELLITYDLQDPDNSDIDITLRVSDNNGETYDISAMNATGDVGFPVNPGTGKVITWDFSNEISMSGKYRVMLVADDREVVDIQHIVDQVDTNRLRDDLKMIVGVRHRTGNPGHLDFVKSLITDRFNAHGLETESLPFLRNNLRGENIAGRKAGFSNEKQIYIIDGHFDTISNSPGADDNGSAIAGMLEALRVLAGYNFQKSIRFVGFDLEEAGLVGSSHFVNTEGLKPYETVEGVFNFEMIGYFDNAPNTQTLPAGFNILYPEVYNAISNDSFRGNFITNVGIQSHPGLNEAFEAAADKYVPELKVISILAPAQWQSLTPDLGRSDHAPFWIAGLPALMLTDGANFRNPNYHSPNDTLGTLNFTFMRQVVKATVAAIAELAEVTHSTSASTDVDILTSVLNHDHCSPVVYPNPNSNFIRLDLTDCLSQNATLEIYTIAGDIMYSRTLDPTLPTLEILTTQWSPGMYLVVIKSGDRSFQRKMIISR
jgi:hypothetical protein